jgi:hypothetical protein
VWAMLSIALVPSANPGAQLVRVRSTDSTLRLLLGEGIQRSATFRARVDRLSELDGIVYVQFGYCAFGHVNGCLLPSLTVAGGVRYLRVLVSADRNRRTRDQLLALIAHELQHALEVLERREVVDVDGMDAMFHRIGTPLPGITGYETSAARATGDAVLSELSLQASR